MDAEEALVVFYHWPKGIKKPRGWTFDTKYSWIVDFNMIHSNLLEPTKISYTAHRDVYVFQQLAHLVKDSEYGAL